MDEWFGLSLFIVINFDKKIITQEILSVLVEFLVKSILLRRTFRQSITDTIAKENSSSNSRSSSSSNSRPNSNSNSISNSDSNSKWSQDSNCEHQNFLICNLLWLLNCNLSRVSTKLCIDCYLLRDILLYYLSD